MKCDNCNYENSEFDIICEKCGAPLNIEKNIELQKKYNHKPKAIDIEYIKIDQSERVFDDTKKKVRISLFIFIGLIIFSVGIISYIVINDIKTNDIMIKYDEFINTSQLGVIYIGNEEDVDKQLTNFVDNYEINYIYISTNKLSKLKKSRIKNDLDIDKISSNIVIINDGVVIDYLNDPEDDKKIIKFLQQNNVLPKEMGNAKEVISNFDLSIVSEEAIIIYIANNKNKANQKHNEEISSFCEDYSINYMFIEGYYLTDNQKLRILKKINYNEIHDELVILVDEGEIKDVTEFVYKSEKEYLELLTNYGIIDVNSNLKKLNLKSLKDLISNKEKQIIMIGTNDCIYCDRLKPIVGKIGVQNNLTIYYLEINEDNRSDIEQYITELGYSEEKISTPLVLITENNQLLDYIIGLSDKSYYQEKFTELGVIR